MKTNQWASVDVSGYSITVLELKSWLDKIPEAAKINVTHTARDRNMGTDYTLKAAWTEDVG